MAQAPAANKAEAHTGGKAQRRMPPTTRGARQYDWQDRKHTRINEGQQTSNIRKKQFHP